MTVAQALAIGSFEPERVQSNSPTGTVGVMEASLLERDVGDMPRRAVDLEKSAGFSLRNWVEEALTREARLRGESFDLHALQTRLQVEVPEQAACEAIANTSKHARPEEGRWPGGEVRLIFQEADEDAPSGYFLQHWNKEDGSEGLALSRFEALCNNWYDLLDSLGLVRDMNRIPDWKQRKLRRTFGRAPLPPLAVTLPISHISEATEPIPSPS